MKLTREYQNYLLQRSKDELKKKKRKGKLTNYVKAANSRPSHTQVTHKYIRANAPTILKLHYESVESTLKYIDYIKRQGFKKRNLNIKLDNVTEIGEGAIAMLLSVMEEISDKGCLIRGSKPKNQSAKDILETSGFFNTVSGKIDDHNKITKNTILKTGDQLTHQKILADEIRIAMDTVWGQKGRNPLVYSSVFEMMRNSCDHAFRKNTKIKWHLGLSHDEKSNKVKFSFVDNGRGITNTFATGKLKAFINIFKDNVDLLETAFKDGIESRTGLSWRGKGLPTIYENYNEKYITNLVVISNDVYIDFDQGIKMKLKNPFSGTYYYWVVDQTCTKACYK